MRAKTALSVIFLAFWGFLGLSPLSGNVRSTQVDFNLIIDGSQAFSAVAADAVAWVSQTIFDEMLETGDRLTIWNAGETAEIIFSENIGDQSAKIRAREILLELPADAGTADFTGALQEAASKPPFSGITYTLLVSSTEAFSNALTGPGANFMRISRIEEFSGWRAVIVGLNLDSRIRQIADTLMQTL